MPEYEVNDDGRWEITANTRLLIEPSAAWLAAREAERLASEKQKALDNAAEVTRFTSFAAPLVQVVNAILVARSLATLTTEERTALRKAAMYLVSQGKHGN